MFVTKYDGILGLRSSVSIIERPRRMSLRLTDLHEVYQTVDAEEARRIANLGAEVYVSVRDRLRAAWSADMSAEESVKADIWRAEGRMLAVEEVRGRLAAAEESSVRLAVAEGTISALRSSIDTEVARRVEEALVMTRKDCELEALKEMSAMREQLAIIPIREKLITMLEEKLKVMEATHEALQAQLLDQMAIATKSSHAIGKAGEATVWELLETGVLPEFLYAEAKNMSGVSHAADFHLWVMRPDGKRMKLLIDAKKYKRAVSSDEIAKLNADVDADNDAHCGMLVSLTSSICNTKQFEMKQTEKGKPILYLSFVDIDAEMYGKLICWGVRALMTASQNMTEEKSYEAQRVEELLSEISAAVKETDGMIKTHMKMVETLQTMKTTVLKKMEKFRRGGVDESTDTIQHVGCVALLKATGMACGREVIPGGIRCREHARRVKEGV